MTTKWIDQQAVPLLKSGQAPRMWPKAYGNFSKNWKPLEDWSNETFIDELVHDHKIASSKFGTVKTKRVNPVMESLEQIGQKYPDYDCHEKALMFPQNSLQLYSKWESNERHKVTLPSKTDLKYYNIAKKLEKNVRKPTAEIEYSDSEDDVPLVNLVKKQRCV
jgi:hypothetical protein